MKRSLIILTITASLLTPFTDRINLHGGRFGTKSMAMWELHRYKDTALLRKSPLCWCPYKAYLEKERSVRVESRNNIHYLIIESDLVKAVKQHSDYNRKHAKIYRGTDREKMLQIYRFCKSIRYTPHMKFARNALEHRQADCAGIASALYVLCKKNNIPVRYIIGWNGNVCHAWNRVKIGRKWYYIDATTHDWISTKQFEGRTVMEIW